MNAPLIVLIRHCRDAEADARHWSLEPNGEGLAAVRLRDAAALQRMISEARLRSLTDRAIH